DDERSYNGGSSPSPTFLYIVEGFLFFVENTAQIARIARGIFKPNHCEVDWGILAGSCKRRRKSILPTIQLLVDWHQGSARVTTSCRAPGRRKRPNPVSTAHPPLHDRKR